MDILETTVNELPPPIVLRDLGDGHFLGPDSEANPGDRDVVFSGQIIAQMILASSKRAGDAKYIKSVHAVFARAARYSAGPLALTVEVMQQGRTWASSTVTAMQSTTLVSRGLVLLTAMEPDLIRHSPEMPTIPGPQKCGPPQSIFGLPGLETRAVPVGGGGTGQATEMATWCRYGGELDGEAGRQAIIAWCQPLLVITSALRAHDGIIDLADVHNGISAAPMSHTSHFHECADPNDWFLVTHQGTYSGNGRIFGTGAVFDCQGTLISTFAQDAMARRADRKRDGRTSL